MYPPWQGQEEGWEMVLGWWACSAGEPAHGAAPRWMASGPSLKVCKHLGFLHVHLGCFNLTVTEMSLLCLNHSQAS